MSQMLSPSTSRSYGLARVTRAWNISRAGVYRFRKASGSPTLICRRGPTARVWTQSWRSISDDKSSDRASTARVTGRYGLGCASPGSREPSPRATSHGEHGLLAPHRTGRCNEKLHDGTIITTRSMKCGERT